LKTFHKEIISVKTTNRPALALVCALGVSIIAACAPESEAPSPPAKEAAGAGLIVDNARVVLAPVAGNPAAVYFDLSYTGAPGITLDTVEVDGAGMTMIHDYAENAGKVQMVMTDAVPLTEGMPVSFAPGGLHVMAMEPAETLKAGATAMITLTLSNGVTTSINAPVRAAGEER